ncbi:hypothetical protein U8V72_23370 [Priestia filamentosa]|uniref:hypothetical protein n=1 Tax=Priestia filamentosa TaxID=1402861 RepID=UPI0012E0425C
MKIYLGDNGIQNKELHDLLVKSDVLGECSVIYKADIDIEKDMLKTCDVIIADVSYPTIHLGMELGWADIYKVDIICVCVKGTAISSHLTKMSKEIVIYTDIPDMIQKLERLFLNNYETIV